MESEVERDVAGARALEEAAQKEERAEVVRVLKRCLRNEDGIVMFLGKEARGGGLWVLKGSDIALVQCLATLLRDEEHWRGIVRKALFFAEAMAEKDHAKDE